MYNNFEEWWQYKIDHMGAIGILASEYKWLCKEAWDAATKTFEKNEKIFLDDVKRMVKIYEEM